MKLWHPVDIVVSFLAVTVAFTIIPPIFGALVLGRPMSENSAELITRLVDGIIGVVSYYVGAKTREGQIAELQAKIGEQDKSGSQRL